MEFNEAKKHIEIFLDDKFRYEFFGKEILSIINYTYHEILKNIKDLTEDKNVKTNDDFINKLLTSLSEVRRSVFMVPLTPAFINFVNAYTEMIYNWNDNSIKNRDISDIIFQINRIIKGHLTMNESIDILKNLTQSLRNFKNWLPPAFEISKHYIDLLNEKGYPSNQDK